MKTLKKKGDIEISKLIGLIIGVIALILIITFVYLNWKPLKESLGKIGENVLGQTKDLLEVDKKRFYDQTLTTQDQQLDEMVGDISKKFDCTDQPDAAIARWKKAIEIISSSKYMGKWKGKEPELQYAIVECYTKVYSPNCDKISKEFKILRDEIQAKGALDFTSKACAELNIYNCLPEEDKQKCQERVSAKGKPPEKEKIEEAINRLKLEGIVEFNKKYKEAIDNFNSKFYEKSARIARDLANAVYEIPITLIPESEFSLDACKNLIRKYSLPGDLCEDRNKFYLSTKYVEVYSNYKLNNNCEEMENRYINDPSGNIFLFKDDASVKNIRFIAGSNIGSSDLSGKPILGQVLYDLGKCFEQKNNEQKIREYFNSLLVSYLNEKITETLIKEKEPKCDSFSKTIGIYTEECNNVNLWLNDKDPRINFDIKKKLKCWGDGLYVARTFEAFFTCESCTKITKCADYKKNELTCIRDPCGFNCKPASPSKLGLISTECVSQ